MRNEATHTANTLRIYTDGSGIQGRIGAAAYSPTKHLYLGTDKQFNVYTAELSAIDLASEFANNAPRPLQGV